MESGAENHPTSGKSGGGGNGGGLSWNIWEQGGPWGGGAGTLHHDPSHHAVPSALFNPTQPTTLNTMSPSPPFFSYHHHHHHHAGAHGGGDAYHLTCLKLGKRQYYEESHASDDPAPVATAGLTKRERVASAAAAAAAAARGVNPSPAAAASSSSGVVPRCQVEGCNVALADAKDYHRRHKVCEMHSKAPKVVVLGMDQRFCQQCSRFHVVTEFDESKRSCRRRLAGHNERRRKSSAESIIGSRNASHLDNTALAGFPYIPASNTPSRALSLLSPKASSAWVSPDLSSQSSAALRELIAENRASVLARQLFSDRGWHSTANTTGAHAALLFMPHQHPLPIDAAAPSQLADGWEHLRGPSPHVTLDLMQMPGASFEFLSAARSRSSSKDDDEECCEIWKSLEGTHVV